MKTWFSGRSDMPFAMMLLAPSLLLLGGLVAWPMLSNIEISFLRLPLNPNISSRFIGLENYIGIIGDPLLRYAIHFSGVCVEVHVQQWLRHRQLPRC